MFLIVHVRFLNHLFKRNIGNFSLGMIEFLFLTVKKRKKWVVSNKMKERNERNKTSPSL